MVTSHASKFGQNVRTRFLSFGKILKHGKYILTWPYWCDMSRVVNFPRIIMVSLFTIIIYCICYILFFYLGLWPGLCRSHKDFLKIFYHSISLLNSLIFKSTEFKPRSGMTWYFRFYGYTFWKFRTSTGNSEFSQKIFECDQLL